MIQYVVVHNNEGSYICYKDFFCQKEWEHLSGKFPYGRNVPTNRVMRLLGIAKHTTFPEQTVMVLEDIQSRAIYLFNTARTGMYTIFNHEPQQKIMWE